MSQNEKPLSPVPDDKVSRRARKIILGLIGTVLLGALGSGLWELLFRPGISRIGSLITQLSSAADAAVFTSAALDPRPVPDLIALLVIVQVPLWFGTFFLVVGYIWPKLQEWLEKRVAHHKDHEALKQSIFGHLRALSTVGLILAVALFLLALSGYRIANESILVWRDFYRNLDICSEQLAPADIASLVAQFRQMRSRADFQALNQRMDLLADKHGIHLQWYAKKN
jgi:hypothetical protein